MTNTKQSFRQNHLLPKDTNRNILQLSPDSVPGVDVLSPAASADAGCLSAPQVPVDVPGQSR